MQTETNTPDVRQDQDETPVSAAPASLLRRLGCGLGVLLWLVVLLIPAALFMLAIQGEIALWHGDRVPDSAAYPLLQVQLIMDLDTRGVSVTTSTPTQQTETRLCMQTHVRYVLWMGQGDAASYCDCYEREASAATWEFISTQSGICKAS